MKIAKYVLHTKRMAGFAAALATAVSMIAVPQQIFAQDSSESVEMHRLYNPNSGEHFYTASEDEKNNLVNVGWNYEGVGWYAPKSSSTPVYRLYNPNAGDHHYTTSTDEREMLIHAGWNDEGTGWYSSDAQTVPLYRQYNPNAVAGAHNFTKSEDENNHLVSVGWRPEGISWYGVVRHWVDEQGHYEDVTEQVWVSNWVDEPVYETKKVGVGTRYIFAEDGYTTTDADDEFWHSVELMKQGYAGNYRMETIYETQTVQTGTKKVDKGSYQTQVTGKKWVVDVPGHWE